MDNMNEFMGRSKIAGDCVFNAKTIFVIEYSYLSIITTLYSIYDIYFASLRILIDKKYS